MAITIKVEGIQETIQMLNELPKNIVLKGFFRAFEASGQVFINAVWPKTPVDMKAAINAAHGKRYKSKVTGEMIGGRGVLVGGLDAFITIDSQLRGGWVDVGFGVSLGHIANWIDAGWRLTGHKPGRKFIRVVEGTGFMRTAFDESAELAVDVFADTIKQVVAEEYKQP